MWDTLRLIPLGLATWLGRLFWWVVRHEVAGWTVLLVLLAAVCLLD